MTVLLRLVSMIGWQGIVGAVAGGLIVAAPAYQAGKWVEGAAAKERIARRLAEREIQRLEVEDDRVAAANRARRQADRRGRAGNDRAPDANGVPDDGFRRD
ncbi:MAG: hypothetical protein ROR55_12035 [Devosia sp.]